MTRTFVLAFLAGVALVAPQTAVAPLAAQQANMSFYDFKTMSLDGKPADLAQYKGKVSLVVNVASKCGYTPQYAGLEALYRRYRSRGLTVLGFPCDQFGNQEPGSETEIRQFCSLAYDVTFPMFAKVEVNGPGTHPLYHHLKDARRGVVGTRAIKWNFTKYLVGRDGEVVDRYASAVTPAHIERAVLPLLREPRGASIHDE